MTHSDAGPVPGRPGAEAPAVPSHDVAQPGEYALTASLLPHVLALRVSYPRDPENPAPGVVGSLVRDGGLWRVKDVPSPSMPLRNAVLSLVMGHRPGLTGPQAMAVADRAVSAYLTDNPGLDYTESHIIDGYTVTLTRPGESKYYRLLVTDSHDAYFEDLGMARAAMPDEVRSGKGDAMPDEVGSGTGDAMNTATLNLGRFTPETSSQRESALAGIAQCDADWAAGELTTSDDMTRQGRNPFWKAGYQVRWLEHAATLPKQRAMTSADVAATMVPDTGDEPARILAEHATPEKLLDYLLTAAERRKREAYAAARAARTADGETPAAEQRYIASYEAAHAGWAVEVASAAAGYAREINATAPATISGADDPALPYNQGWHNGAGLLIPEILTHRPGGYSDSQWREFAAGYAAGAQVHAEATTRYARAVQDLEQQNPVEPARPAATQEQGRPATPGLATGHAFTGEVGTRRPPGPAGRPPGGITSPAAPARPRGPQ